MTYHQRPVAAALAIDLTRRQLFARFGTLAALAGLSAVPSVRRASARETPTAADVDQDTLQALLDLSRALCGGGDFDPGRGATLLQLLSADPALARGLDELLAAPPPADAAATSAETRAASDAILLYWYAGSFAGEPVADRAIAYYGLIAWQAMYTFPPSICRGFGVWADPPQTAPLVAGT